MCVRTPEARENVDIYQTLPASIAAPFVEVAGHLVIVLVATYSLRVSQPT